MKRFLIAPAILAAGLLSIATTASAAPQCTDRPRSEWKTEEQMKAEIDKMGYKDIKTFQISGNCYEIYGHTKDGRRAEVYFNPVTGEIVQHDESDAGPSPFNGGRSALALRTRRVRVWDPVVRIFHWTVALGVIANLTVLEHARKPHVYVGYVVVAALVVRLGWGVVARNRARFAAFVPGPGELFAYLKLLAGGREPRYVGHNPAGAAMMVALMVLVLVVGTTGWMMGLDRFWGVHWVETVHEITANLILAAAIMHVMGAVVESVRHHENLPWSMVTGYKRAATGTDVDDAPSSGRG